MTYQCDKTVSCPCPECRVVRAAHWKDNPLIKPRRETILWGQIPEHQKKAYLLEERDILEAKIAICEAEIKILDDEYGEVPA